MLLLLLPYLQVVFEKVMEAKQEGGPFAGALIWNIAHNDSGDTDGYNVYLDRWQRTSVRPLFQYKGADGGGSRGPDNRQAAAVPGAAAVLAPITGGEEEKAAAAAKRGADAKVQAQGEAVTGDAAEPKRRRRQLLAAGAQQVEGGTQGSSGSQQKRVMNAAERQQQGLQQASSTDRGSSRQLLWVQEQLDGFRRGWDRGSCAHESSRTWRPPPLPDLVDLQAYRRLITSVDAVDIIATAASVINS